MFQIGIQRSERTLMRHKVRDGKDELRSALSADGLCVEQDKADIVVRIRFHRPLHNDVSLVRKVDLSGELISYFCIRYAIAKSVGADKKFVSR